MTWAEKNRAPKSPVSPALNALTLVSQESDDTVASPHAVSAQERAWYYLGITDDGDQPELLYRTSLEKDPWVAPTGRHANPPFKFARPVHGTSLNKVWDTVGPQIDDLVFATIKTRYSIDPARFLTVPTGEDVKNGTLGPVVIWVTVYPDSTSVDTAHEVSQKILQLLAKNGVDDAEVEWCEGVVWKAIGPVSGSPLLPVVSKRNATAHVRRHLTAALGIPIAPARSEMREGQGSLGFFFHENLDKRGEVSGKVLAVTNHHVLCKQEDKKYDFRSHGSPQHYVRVCGPRRFERGIDEIKQAVVNHGNNAGRCAEEIADLEAKVANGGGDEDDAHNLEKARQELEDERKAIVELKKFYMEVNADWSDIGCRDIGVLEYSPPISVNVEGRRYTQDWATIRLDEPKLKPNFLGNVIDLGTAIHPNQLTELLYPRDANTTFKYPKDRLLRIRGFVTKERNPDSLDLGGEPCIVVLKDGCSTDLTVGRYAGLESYQCDENAVRSVECAVYNYDKQSGPFSAKGDSGSLIVTGNGEMVGLLHSGKSKIFGSAPHCTYATPAWRLCEWIKEIYPNADFFRETW